MEKPFKSYNGGKSGHGTYQQIINLIPKMDVYVDGMVGGGGIFFNLNLPSITVVNDIDSCIAREYEKFQSAQILVRNSDYGSLIVEFDVVVPKAFFYFDPPYKLDTRKSKKPLYRFEWNDSDHEKFLQAAVNIKSNCMISHYPCEMYDSALDGWYTHDFQSMTRKGLRTQRVYMNYPAPEVLQDFRYLGNDYRERQRIKRKIDRHISRLESLPMCDRMGILSALIAKYNGTAAQLI